jgi:hypothetical protein
MSVVLLIAVPVLGMLAAVELAVMVVVAHICEARSRREARKGIGGVA